MFIYIDSLSVNFQTLVCGSMKISNNHISHLRVEMDPLYLAQLHHYLASAAAAAAAAGHLPPGVAALPQAAGGHLLPSAFGGVEQVDPRLGGAQQDRVKVINSK